MTDEEKPIVAVESSQPGEPARPPSKWTGRRIVAVAVTLTTLLGGVWTVIQLSEWTFYRPNEEKLEAGWRRVQLQGGGSIAMPQSWDVVEKQALLAQGRLRGFDQGLLDFMEGWIRAENSLTFITEVEGRWPAPFAIVLPIRKVKWDEKALIEDLRRRGFLAEGDSLNGRPAIHAIGNPRVVGSDPPIHLVQDIYVIKQTNEPWAVFYLVDSSLHLDYSGMIRRMTESLTVR